MCVCICGGIPGMYLNILKGDVEGERLVVVGVECALFDGGLFLADPLSVLHQDHFHVRI